MNKNELEYSCEIRPLSKDDGGGYLITFPDLPGCMSDGDSIKEAIENGKDAVNCWLEAAKERGQYIAQPKTKYSGQFVQRIPKSLHARLVAFAKNEGVSMNTLVAQFISEGLVKSELKANPGILAEELKTSEKSSGKSISQSLQINLKVHAL